MKCLLYKYIDLGSPGPKLDLVACMCNPTSEGREMNRSLGLVGHTF